MGHPASEFTYFELAYFSVCVLISFQVGSSLQSQDIAVLLGTEDGPFQNPRHTPCIQPLPGLGFAK